MPLKQKGEKLSHFIGRFMKSKREERHFPEQSQRLAVGYAEAREHSKQRRHHAKA